MNLQELKNNDWYIQMDVDTINKYKSYSIVRDTSDTGRDILGELNRKAFLLAKQTLIVIERDTVFLNSIPFAERNKENTPMIEQWKN